MLEEGHLHHSSGQTYAIKLATEADVPAVRRLVNRAYKELADMGLNCTCSYQDEEVTRQRMAMGQTLLLFDQDLLVGTIHLREDLLETGERCAYICQFGILPEYKRRRLGSMLMEKAEKAARKNGYRSVRLDTPKPAQHLVEFYLRRGYHIVRDIHLEGKTYDSCLFQKALSELPT